ncbi:MAG: NAD-dependent epimerase/dehydratase family protein [bacterium]
MKILITGATGFVGSNLVLELMNKKYDVNIVVRNIAKAKKILKGIKDNSIISLEDNKWKDKVKNLNPEIAIHLASHLTSNDDSESIKKLLSANLVFGTHILDALASGDLKYFVNIGTFAEYCNDDGKLSSSYLYSATKTAYRAIIDYYYKKTKFKWINVIPYTIYGGKDSHQKVVDYIISSINSQKAIKMTKGEQVLDFIHINDVVNFFILLIRNINKINNGYTEYYLGTGTGTSIRKVSEIVEKAFCKKTNITWGALPYRENDIMKAIAPIEKNEKYFEWNCKIDINKGIQIYKESLQE